MDPAGYDFWLLDLDGTLVDVDPDYVHEVMAEVGDRVGYTIGRRDAEALWYGLGGERNALLREWGVDTDAFWTVFHEVEDPVARAENSFLYDDARCIAGLDRPVGLVTHSQPYLTEAVLDALDLRDWFDAVVCCTDDLGWKPDPAPVRAAMRALDVTEPVTDGGSNRSSDARGVLVGDGPQDVGAAWNAGLDGVHVERHGHDRRGLCVRGDYRVTGLDDLLSESGR